MSARRRLYFVLKDDVIFRGLFGKQPRLTCLGVPELTAETVAFRAWFYVIQSYQDLA
jgi:hypothetical protein